MKWRLLCVSLLLASVSIAAQTAATLSDILEQAAYQQDTANNPENAIKLYRQVIESEKATRQMSAQALYNTGLCYEKLKRRTEANQAFGAVVSQYKDIQPYFGLADARLNPSFTPTVPRWQDGERLEYEIRVKSVDKVQNYYWTTTTKVNWNGRTAWKLLNRSLQNDGLSMTIADETSLRPLYSRAVNPNIGQATATWTDNSIKITRADQESAREIPFEGAAYDGEQQRWLFRQIPMSIGTRIKSQLLSALVTDKAVPLEIEVTGEEQVEVPAGKFHAYKLSTPGGTTNIWIDKGPERYYLKSESATSSLELKRISTVTPGAWRTVTSDTSSFRISIPDEWFNATKMVERQHSGTKTTSGKAESSSFAIPNEQIAIIDDDTKLRISIYVIDSQRLQEYDNFDLSLAGWAADPTMLLPRDIENFVVREGSRTDRLIANVPAISTIADMQQRKVDWVMYSTYIKRDTKLIWIGCNARKEHFNEAKPTFDRILSTISF